MPIQPDYNNKIETETLSRTTSKDNRVREREIKREEKHKQTNIQETQAKNS